MLIDVLTLFPEVFEPFVASSIIGRAAASGLVSIRLTNFRDFARDKHRSVDHKPYGGGPGMVLTCGPVFDALDYVQSLEDGAAKRILLSPQGKRLTQETVRALAREEWLIILCGHYEGFDERIRTGMGADELSIGDYVLSGGEAAAMVLVDAVIRMLPGSLGDEASAANDSFSNGLLEHPQYTKPQEFRGMKVPDVLLSGDHARIAAWRLAEAKRRTASRRPDMLQAGEEPQRDG